ncbi:NAD(P)/FAD-dependent oxidoreductase [Streptomyces flaveus]|uniref:FAD-dependent pyridine nucleotide-disulphide oxidoreductase n=1 Tax=Streptomyces flaveus TaxID=66370 RepID=A0A917RR44_9ACTN|nr:NAD(P)/FAD-dependent oxidoreductase [Streptomyces flaveus]GGL18826.1 putative FAD-dependent pyridine nucleotide-disulphide oxidoreductase [Streptomyces flaveus]
MNTQMTESSQGRRFDVVVVGGGAAGLSAALTLSRARRSVLVIDSGKPRNAPAAHAHNYLGREGISPLELLATGRTEVTGYGGEIRDGSVLSAERLAEGHFRVVLADGSAVESRRLLVATGVVDELPDIPGMAERWGRDVLHCPYCHGWEVRDQPIGILAQGPAAMHQALLWRQWTTDLTVFLNGSPELTDQEREQLAARQIALVEGRVESLEVTDDGISGVRLHDGRTVAVRAVVVPPNAHARADVLVSLGLRTTSQQFGTQSIGTYVPATDPTGATEVAGVWLAGNVTNLAEQVIGAAAAGVNTAAAINADLVTEDTRQAVASRRSR